MIHYQNFSSKTLLRLSDLGNILTISDQHPTQVYIVDNVISLEEGRENNVLGRSIVVHAGEDDLGTTYLHYVDI